MKKILFVMNTMGLAGAEKALVEFISSGALDEYELHLYVLLNRGRMFAQISDRVKILNAKPDAGSVLSTFGRIRMALTVLRALLYKGWIFRNIGYMRDNIRSQRAHGKIHIEKLFWAALSDSAPSPREHYELAVAYLEGASTYYIADRVDADKKAAFVHTDYVRAGYTQVIDRNCYEKIDRVFAVSKQAGEKFLTVYPQYRDKLRLFRNIINADEIKKLAAQPGFDDGFTGARLLTVGRLCYEKGYDVAIAAAALLKAQNINFRWYVLGDGPLRKKLQRQIVSAGVENEFKLLGAVSNPYPYINDALVYVHATRYEGKSVAVEEAQCLNKPIVASDCEGNREQIEDGVDGLLVPLGAESVASAVKNVLENEELRRSLIENVSKKQLVYNNDINAFYELLS